MSKVNYELKNWWESGILPTGHSDPDRQSAEVFWSGSDSRENFLKNKTPGYTETSIIYKYNSRGFRTHEFQSNTDKVNILFLGCSHTEGVGLKEGDTWVYKVSEHFSKDTHVCYNLGVGGKSTDTVARNLLNATGSLLTPGIVFILWPPLERYDYYTQDGDVSMCSTNGAWNATSDTMFLYEEAHSYNNYVRNRALVHLLQEKHKFILIELRSDELQKEFRRMPRPLDYARDNHWPPSLHTYVADRYISLYQYILATQQTNNKE